MTEYNPFDGIWFIQMGGTIDKEYPATRDNHGYNFEVGHPAFGRILERAGPKGSRWSVWEAVQKDSLDITDADRRFVAERIDRTATKRIIITHGTDTIRETAMTFARFALDRTIVFTGAMQPERFRDSDADFNLGMAVAAVSALPPGIYIALYGEVERCEAFTSR